MLVFGDLIDDGSRLDQLGGVGALVAAAGTGETLIDEGGGGKSDGTMVFQHETIAMMRAERANKLDKLRGAISEKSLVMPIEKKPESVWDHITLGRATSADIVLEDPAVSSVHAHFALDDDSNRLSVQDVGSSNGTFVNREQLQPGEQIRLSSGDCVRFGQMVFYYINKSMLKELLDREGQGAPS